ncbi:MAG: hypothetical protein DCC71_15445 [Proteobacteria bacterium]|nr:MAG: hypothetical protein DCC71_15445 [Pseudomonadota bacterium]
MKRAGVALVAVLLVGCAAVELDDQGARVVAIGKARARVECDAARCELEAKGGALSSAFGNLLRALAGFAL